MFGICLAVLAVFLAPAVDAEDYSTNISEDDGECIDNSTIIPYNYEWHVRAGNTTMLFKNFHFNLYLHRNLQLNLSVGNGVDFEDFCMELNPGDPLQLQMKVASSLGPGIPEASRSIGTYFTIEPNSTQNINASLKLYVHRERIRNRTGQDIEPKRLTWCFYNETSEQWETVPSYVDANGYLVAETTHFSTWTVIEVEDDSEESTNMLLIAAIVSIGAIAALGVIKLKK